MRNINSLLYLLGVGASLKRVEFRERTVKNALVTSRLPPLALAISLLLVRSAFGTPEPPRQLTLLPDTISAARKYGMSVEGIPAIDQPGAIGDRVVVLFQLSDGANNAQWLVEAKSAHLSNNEKGKKPSAGLGAFGVFVDDIRSSSGRRFDFPSTAAVIELRTVGPLGSLKSLTRDSGLKEQSSRAIVNQDYLEMGLAQLCEVEIALKAAGKTDPSINLKLMGSFSDEEIAGTKARMADVGVSEEFERLYVYSNMAVLQFASIAQQTAGVSDVLRLISDKPGLMSAGNLFLDWKSCAVEPSEGWGVGNLRIYSVPFIYSLKKTTAKGVFYVTYPYSPLQTIGGILAVTCESSKSPGVTLTIRALAGERGAIGAK